jgi:hypothetical protein
MNIDNKKFWCAYFALWIDKNYKWKDKTHCVDNCYICSYSCQYTKI